MCMGHDGTTMEVPMDTESKSMVTPAQHARMIEQVARICHNVNRAYCQSLGDDSQPEWDAAPEWHRESLCKGVQFHYEHPEATFEDSHNKWLEEKRAAGWKYGPVKDVEKKEHPCFMPYSELPDPQKTKDALFKAVCTGFFKH